MSFIQIGFLGALAALAIPIIIHLVFRQRAETVELGTLRFLRVVLEQNARRRRVMRWLLLVAAAGCVALAGVSVCPALLAGVARRRREADRGRADRPLGDDGAQAATASGRSSGPWPRSRTLLAKPASNTRFEIAFFDHAVQPLAECRIGETAKSGDAARRESAPSC